MSDIAIKVDHLTKEYRLGAIGGGTLRGDLQTLWAKIRHKEDPNAKIGQRTDIKIGERFLALDDVSFEVKKGEALGIIGHNGAGKSTLLKILSRVTGPSKGSIQFNGRIASMLEVGTGFHPELTGRENIYMNGAILGMSKAEISKKFDEIVEFAEIAKFIDTPVKRYSSGMYVKLAFSVAAHLDSEIMIMDEVLAVGDFNFQQKCLKKMRDVAHNDGRTVLYVSHNMDTIRQLCSQCLVLSRGKCIYLGDVVRSIELYLKNRNDVLSKFNDTSMTKRDINLTNACKLEHVELEKNILKQGEPLQFTTTINSSLTGDNFLIRFVVFNEVGHVVGATYTDYFSLKKEKNETSFQFITDMLAPGRYWADIIICTYDGQIQIRHDCVAEAFHFEVQEVSPLYNIPWNYNGWGNIKFSTLQEIQK